MAYIKLKFRFWSLQPVFHIYDFQYYLFPIGIIDQELPEKNKYCNFKSIETIKYDELSGFRINKFIKFICSNYLQNNENTYEPKKSNIMPYFEGHNASSFFSFYYEDEILVNLKDNNTELTKKLIGVMTSRPINVTIYKKNKLKPTRELFSIYYVDYLCVDKNYRKKGIAQQVIQTHHYKQRHNNRQIVVSLFKREDELTGIVPLCVYNTYGFDMNRWIKPPELIPTDGSLIECSKTNIYYLFDFMRENMETNFDICIISEISNILELIKTQNIYIYFIIENDNIICAYFFRKTCTLIRNKCEAICLFASINSVYCSNDIFIHGYKISLWKICEKFGFKFAVIEEISDNYLIIENLKLKTKPSIISPTAYFFYNFAYHTFQSKKTFILN